MPLPDVVITGVGIVSPIGIGREAFWSALCEGRSGVAPISLFDPAELPVRIAAEVADFDPKAFVTKRKSLKVMCRDAQLGVAAAALACQDAELHVGTVAAERFGVVLGADRIYCNIEDSLATYGACMVDGQYDGTRWGTAGLKATYPLSFLRVLPNMIGSHISIAHDAQGPNNTIHHADVSGLLAISEAARTIQRGAADVMLAGGASSQMHPFDCARRCAMGILSAEQDDPAAAVRPFDKLRDGLIWGEGSAMFLLESRHHAENRGANIVGQLLGWASAGEPCGRHNDTQGTGLRRAIQWAMGRAERTADDLSHVNAHGEGSRRLDRIEAQTLHTTVPDVPVTALKSYFGTVGAASGAIEMAGSLLALSTGLVPATLNYQTPDTDCPLHVIHGEPLESTASSALLVDLTFIGQAAAMVVGRTD